MESGRYKEFMDDVHKSRRRRKPRKATPKSLENAAIAYLGRFSSSCANLERVLMRRVEKSVRHHGTDAQEGAAMVKSLVAKLAGAGLVNDRQYAEGRALSLHRRGASSRLIRAKLAEKGVGAAEIDRALTTLAEEAPDPDFAAAAALARRRRLGPYRAAADRPDRRERDLAALARAGFGYDIARAVIDAANADELETVSREGSFR